MQRKYRIKKYFIFILSATGLINWNSSSTTLDMAYHYDKGGIFTKSDVGSYLYNNTLKPYALSEISPTSAIIPNTVDSLTYTSFESVSTIMEDPYSASFVYNADNQRAKMEVKQNTTTILTRWYPSGSYIKEIASGTTKEYTFIGGDPYTAPVVAITQSGTTTYYFLLRDHLGSITHVVDASTGTLSYQYSYDAWGRMRTPTGWVNYNPGSEPALFNAGRGFTGHEHLPWFNLINMLSEGLGNEVISNGAKSRDPGFPGEAGNGRVYDPLTGQFLSPDNNIQDPYNSQNLNRYSYCLNNPLKYTDPTGFTASVSVEYIHDIIYGPQSRVDLMLRELFGAMYEDVYHGGADYAFLLSGFGGSSSSGGGADSFPATDSDLNHTQGAQTDDEKYSLFKYLLLMYNPIDALKFMINSYNLDENVKGLYKINIVNNKERFITTDNPLGTIQLITFSSSRLIKPEDFFWGNLIRDTYHELIHVEQRFYHIPYRNYDNHEEREFLATKTAFWANWLPDISQSHRLQIISYGVRHYNQMPNNLQMHYLMDYYDLIMNPYLY